MGRAKQEINWEGGEMIEFFISLVVGILILLISTLFCEGINKEDFEGNFWMILAILTVGYILFFGMWALSEKNVYVNS